jgi:hypothetical protein
VRLLIKLRNDDEKIILNFETEETRNRHFDEIRKSMGKITKDIWCSSTLAIRVDDIVYIEKTE